MIRQPSQLRHRHGRPRHWPPAAIRRPGEPAESLARQDRPACQLCGHPIPPSHRHILDVSHCAVLCACEVCTGRRAASMAGERPWGSA